MTPDWIRSKGLSSADHGAGVASMVGAILSRPRRRAGYLDEFLSTARRNLPKIGPPLSGKVHMPSRERPTISPFPGSCRFLWQNVEIRLHVLKSGPGGCRVGSVSGAGTEPATAPNVGASALRDPDGPK